MHQSYKLSIRELPKTKKMAIDEQHPMLKLQNNKFVTEEEERLAEIGMIYGSAMAMMIRHERHVLAQPERMPGLSVALESHMGRLDKLGFEDVFGKDNSLMKGPDAHDLYLQQFK